MPILDAVHTIEKGDSIEKPRPARRWLDSAIPPSHRGRGLLLLLVTTASLAPIWTVRYPPLRDYPNHLASAFVLAHLKDPAFHFSQFYVADWNMGPYLLMDVILVGLQQFMSIYVAGRLLLSLCVLALPASAWFFLRQANPNEESLALWSLLVSTNYLFFLYGFIGMQLSVALCFVVLGLWLRYLDRPHLASWCLLLAATTVLYFTHLMGFGIAALVMTTYALFARLGIRQIFLSWLLFLPGALLCIHSAAAGSTVSRSFHFLGLGGKLAGLLLIVAGRSPALDFFTLLVVAGCVFLAGSKNPEFQWNRHWPGVVACMAALYVILPAGYGTHFEVDRRLLPVTFILSLAMVRVGRRARHLAVIAVLLFLLRAAVLERHFLDVQPKAVRLAQAFLAIDVSTRVLCLGHGDMPHLWAYGVIERGWFSPCLFHDPGVEPLQMSVPVYVPTVSRLVPCGAEVPPLDWPDIRNNFDYVWAYSVPQLAAELPSIGTQVFADNGLKVIHLKR